MEKINVNKTGKSKYGFYLMLDDKSFLGTTEAVSNFVNGKLPAELEVIGKEQENGKDKITKVRFLSNKPQESSKREDIERMAELKSRTMVQCSAVDNATKLVIANEDTNKTPEQVVIYARELLKFMGYSEGENPSQKPKQKTNKLEKQKAVYYD